MKPIAWARFSHVEKYWRWFGRSGRTLVPDLLIEKRTSGQDASTYRVFWLEAGARIELGVARDLEHAKQLADHERCTRRAAKWTTGPSEE